MAVQLIGCVLLSCLAASTICAQFNARITQVDTGNFPHIRVYVSVTDAAGNPINDEQPVTLNLFENGAPVSKNVLSQGHQVYSVLVLDLSGSMKGDKLDKAKAAALSYINMAPPSFRIAVVGFADNVRQIAPFSTDKKYLRDSISPLQAAGETALQDGIGKGLNMLRGQPGRRSVIALTDGIENRSRTYSQRQLIDMGLQDQMTISIIGLGDNVNVSYLKEYERTRGTYLFSPTPFQLAGAFGQVAKLLDKERVIDYVTSNASADGTRNNLSVELAVGNTSQKNDWVYVRPGLIPHVRGEHTPFALLIVLLMIVPSVLVFMRSLLVVHRFRAHHVKRLAPGSEYINKKDPYYPPDHRPFGVGDLIVVCPGSKTTYFVRSWRMLKCKCPRGETNCAGYFCYQRALPQWLRKMLDRLFEKKQGTAGRRWLCRCAGDKDGY
ncbi:MAG: vWA domain-containing protein [Pyrinomonadaceae bacterium]